MAHLGLLGLRVTLRNMICILSVIIVLTRHSGGCYCVMFMHILEVSNLFKHGRHILRHLGMEHTLLYEYTYLAFMATMVYGRSIAAYYVVFLTFACTQNHIFIRHAAAFFLVVTQWFVFGLIRPYRKMHLEGTMRTVMEVEMQWFEPLTRRQKAQLGILDKKE